MKKHTWKIVLGAVVLLMGGSFLLSYWSGSQANEGVVLEEHIKGNKDAAVTLTEYADFQCPACAQFHPIVKSVETQYGDRVAIEFKHMPLSTIHPYALPAAKAAEAAGVQGKFFEMHDKLFENQTAWSQSGTPQVFFNQYAEELGLDVELFKQHMRASLVEDKIKTDFEEARSLGFTGTPSFMLNGETLKFETFDEFFGAIEAALGIVPTEASSTVPVAADVEFGI